ncbi:hypothetical protein ABID21_001730 [Pseudorhizobium tarimense]|uniref:DUF982 domain-containing protein n=1 Tax=Pseudorhizobium tarimense TaxID=1079109 RepID=A0ABV2H4Z8_9HYPH|nr:DUF982 domain-containing protein [Pseudorhizobium tarimense]MCJ8518840.1 DUF982 domain-containing protein [Pseudorhizobium tarimense]
MIDMELPWRAPVNVRLQCGLERTFLSVHDALDFLENEWPLRRGERYQRAVRKCRAALRRLVPDEVAREAFIAACFEAGMPMVAAGPLRYDSTSAALADLAIA